MNVSPDTMRTLLILCMAGMALLALLYLHRREMPDQAYLAWGLLAVALPLLGPFLVILNHPGRLRLEYRQPPIRHVSAQYNFLARCRRLGQIVQNYLGHLL